MILDLTSLIGHLKLLKPHHILSCRAFDRSFSGFTFFFWNYGLSRIRQYSLLNPDLFTASSFQRGVSISIRWDAVNGNGIHTCLVKLTRLVRYFCSVIENVYMKEL